MDQDAFRIITGGIADTTEVLGRLKFKQTRRWSYGDVENNGVYYHPNLTHYAHQVFEEFFAERVGLHYTNLSGTDCQSEETRKRRGIERMTFPVEWLHQYMKYPMAAGDRFDIGIDTVKIDARRVGVRAFVFDSQNRIAAVVMWVRWALLLPGRTPIDIPAWFPTS